MKIDSLEELILIAKALSEEHRIKVLYVLQNGELCACDIIGYLGLAPSTVSRHLAVLKQSGLVSSRKSGRWVFFRIQDTLTPIAHTMLQAALTAYRNSPRTKDDQINAREISCGDWCNEE